MIFFSVVLYSFLIWGYLCVCLYLHYDITGDQLTIVSAPPMIDFCKLFNKMHYNALYSMHFNLKNNIQFKYYTRYVSIVGTILIRQHSIFFFFNVR